MEVQVWSVINIADFVAIGVFAVSGALAAAEKKLDILSFILFGTITGIGGGTLRDLLLGIDTVFWVTDTRYLWVCIGCSAATWYLAPMLNSLHRVLLWADAIGIALFSVLGSAKALTFGAPPVVAAVLGMMTATFGSLIRDTLLNQEPVLLGPEIYVTAALLGSVSYIALQSFELTGFIALPISIILAFLLRACAIVYDLRLPKYGR
jgi:uncharacterized membrane protein YeiH